MSVGGIGKTAPRLDHEQLDDDREQDAGDTDREHRHAPAEEMRQRATTHRAARRAEHDAQ